MNACHRLCLSAVFAFTLGMTSPASGQEHQHQAPESPALARIKSLVGTWVSVGDDGQPTDEVVSVYRETAGGSAIHETLFPGQPHEMITLYYQEGEDLMLTHYCMLGNQPRMKAAASSSDQQIVFEFAGGANIKPDVDAHMHQGVVHFIDENTIESAWTEWADGKPGEVVKLTLKRKQ